MKMNIKAELENQEQLDQFMGLSMKWGRNDVMVEESEGAVEVFF